MGRVLADEQGLPVLRGPANYPHPVNIAGDNPNPKPTPLARCEKQPGPTEEDFPPPLPVHLL